MSGFATNQDLAVACDIKTLRDSRRPITEIPNVVSARIEETLEA
jgi:hypothetical protein